MSTSHGGTLRRPATSIACYSNHFSIFDFWRRTLSKLVGLPACELPARELAFSADDRHVLFSSGPIFLFDGSTLRALTRGRAAAFYAGGQSITSVRQEMLYVMRHKPRRALVRRNSTHNSPRRVLSPNSHLSSHKGSGRNHPEELNSGAWGTSISSSSR